MNAGLYPVIQSSHSLSYDGLIASSKTSSPDSAI